MLFEAKSLSNLPVVSLESGQTLGFVSNIIIDPDNGKVSGLLSSSNFFWENKKAVAISDIREFTPEAILVKNDESLLKLDELVRIKKVVEQKIFILESNVITESGEKLGKVVDFVINTDLEILVKIYVEKTLGRGLMQGILVIAASQIISIERKKIIVADNTLKEEIEEQETVEEAATT